MTADLISADQLRYPLVTLTDEAFELVEGLGQLATQSKAQLAAGALVGQVLTDREGRSFRVERVRDLGSSAPKGLEWLLAGVFGRRVAVDLAATEPVAAEAIRGPFLDSLDQNPDYWGGELIHAHACEHRDMETALEDLRRGVVAAKTTSELVRLAGLEPGTF